MVIRCGENKQPAAVQPSIATLAPNASLIFKGTVKKLHDSTVSVVPATDSTVVVHVDEVLDGAKTIGDFTGQDITVQLKEPKSVKEDEKLLFFANAGTFGKSVSVVEVGHTSAEGESAQIRRQISDARKKQADRKLQQRLAKAEIVIEGKVTDVKPVARAGEEDPVSEHDPEWWEATVQIQSTQKGKPKGQTVVVYFPHSSDIRWAQAPKLKKGQEGVFSLHNLEDKKRAIKGYAVTDPLDVHPKNQLERVRALIKAK
jgi:hypothetical protein